MKPAAIARAVTNPAGWILLLAVNTAIAAEQTTRHMEGDERFWWTLLAVQVLCSMGYAASSLAQWAGWPDGSLAVRLNIVQGGVTAFLAGNIGFYGAYYYFTLAEVASFIAAAVAAWGGDKFISPILSRITGKIGEAQAP